MGSVALGVSVWGFRGFGLVPGASSFNLKVSRSLVSIDPTLILQKPRDSFYNFTMKGTKDPNLH